MTLLATLIAAATPFVLRYAEPADLWNEALPIGNGRLGAMVFGGVRTERLQLNEDTFWSGGPHDGVEPRIREPLLRAKEMCLAGDVAGAYVAVTNCGVKLNSSHPAWYQTLGSLMLRFYDAGRAENYRRELSLDEAVATVSYDCNGVTFARETFASFSDNVIVLRLTASEPGRLSFDAWYESPLLRSARPSSDGTDIVLLERADPVGGIFDTMRACVRASPIVSGGLAASADGVLSVRGADAVTLVLSAATSFVDWHDGTSGDERGRCAAFLSRARKRDFKDLRARHVAEYSRRIGDCDLSLGPERQQGRTIPDRLSAVAEGYSDPHLEALYFRYGRYLLTSSSSPGAQAANLQGVWNEWRQPPWNSYYVADANVQMCYWPCDVCGMDEQYEPYWKMLEELAESGRGTARRMYGCRGWVMHCHTDIWRTTGGGYAFTTGHWTMGGVWMATHILEHYLFTQDKAFLRRMYPVLLDAARFCRDWSGIDAKTGRRTIAPTMSPENVPPGQTYRFCSGAAIDAQIMRDIFSDVLFAARELGLEDEETGGFAKTALELEPIRIGRWGQLQEWTEDVDDPGDRHRHISHLYALYPSAQITAGTPELEKASKVTLNARGDEATGWGVAWRACWWARLRDGERAHKILRDQLKPFRSSLGGYSGGTYPNLLDAHPPFQLDGNLGCTAAICEMLLQSHERTPDGRVLIRLLPACPRAWPDGEVTAFRARGGYSVSFRWSGGKVVSFKVSGGNAGGYEIKK